MSLRYGNKIAPNYLKNQSLLGNNRSFYPSRTRGVQSVSNAWERPSDWLDVTVPSSSEQKVVLLVAVYNIDSNLLSLNFQGNYTVDWGDGTVQNFNSNVQSNRNYNFSSISNSTLTSDGFKQVIVTITPQAGQNLTTINLRATPPQIASGQGPSMLILEAYVSASLATSLTIGSINTSNGDTYNRALAYANLINVSSLTTFANLFYNCYNLRKVDVGLVSSGLTSTASMFQGCNSLLTAPLFNTASVTNMNSMFHTCYSLQTVPLYDASSVVNMGLMFNDCRLLETIPPLNTSSVQLMNSMFNNCYSLKEVPLFDTRNVITMSSMFSSCFSLKSVPPFDMSKVGNAGSMFNNCYSLVNIPITNTKVLSAANGMFGTCTSLETIKSFDTTNIVNAGGMFSSCYSLVNVPEIMNMPNCTTLTSMFSQCFSLVKAPMIIAPNNTSTSTMFSNCQSLTGIPLYNTENVTDFSNMFLNCYSLQTIPQISTVKATNVGGMFNTCYSLVSVPELNFGRLSNAITNLFASCFNLRTAPISANGYPLTLTSTMLSRSALEAIFDRLQGVNSLLLTITNAYGAAGALAEDTAFSRAANTTLNSITAVCTNTSSLSVGMQVVGTGSPLTTTKSVSTTNSPLNLITYNSHGLSNGDEVAFNSVTTTTGITLNTIYYVISATTNNFKISTTPGGSEVVFGTGNGSATMRNRAQIARIVPNANIIFDRPMSSTSSTTLTFRFLRTGTALLKNWSVTG